MHLDKFVKKLWKSLLRVRDLVRVDDPSAQARQSAWQDLVTPIGKTIQLGNSWKSQSEKLRSIVVLCPEIHSGFPVSVDMIQVGPVINQ